MSLRAMIEHAQSEEDVRALARKRLQLAVPAILPTGARSAIVHDISVGGLLLETDSSMSIGETIAIELPEAKPVEARIVWSSGKFFGCEFAETIPSRSVSASLLKSEPLQRLEGGSEASGAEILATESDDRLHQGDLSTAARIQIVVAISALLWTLIVAAIALL